MFGFEGMENSILNERGEMIAPLFMAIEDSRNGILLRDQTWLKTFFDYSYTFEYFKKKGMKWPHFTGQRRLLRKIRKNILQDTDFAKLRTQNAQ